MAAVEDLIHFLVSAETHLDEAEHVHYFELLYYYNSPADLDFWPLIHPVIRKIARARFYHANYADSVFAAMIEVEGKVRDIVKERTGEEISGSPLMQKAFSPRSPVIMLDDLTTQTGRDRQRGYMELFSGAMRAIRNPKAHHNLTITRENAIHLLFLASSLLYALEDAMAAEQAREKNVASTNQT